MLVKTARLVITTKLLDEAYPDYMQVIPKTDGTEIAMNRVEFLGALDRISVFMTISPCVILTFGENKLVLNSGDTELGSSHDEIPVKYDGETIEMRFNPYYVRDALTAMDDEEVVMKITNSAAPAIIKKVGANDYTYVVMPLRV